MIYRIKALCACGATAWSGPATTETITPTSLTLRLEFRPDSPVGTRLAAGACIECEDRAARSETPPTPKSRRGAW